MPWRWRLRGEALDWTEFAKTASATTVALGVIAYFLRRVFGQVLSRDLQKFKADLTAKHDFEIERLRNDLRIAASEHETRFTRLHETRAEVISELYNRFVRACEAFEVYLNTVLFGSDPDPAKEEVVLKRWCDFKDYFSEKRIYFEEGLCSDIDVELGQYFKAWVRTGGYPRELAGTVEEWSKAALHFGEQFPPIRAKIEHQFRELIGVQKSQIDGQRATDKGHEKST
jgi:hypothetical protein